MSDYEEIIHYRNGDISVYNEPIKIYLEFEKYLSIDKKLILIELCNLSFNHFKIYIFVDFYQYIKDDKFASSIFEKIIVKYLSNKQLLYFSTYIGSEEIFDRCEKNNNIVLDILVNNAFIGGNKNIIKKIKEIYNIENPEMIINKLDIFKHLISTDKYDLFLFYEKKWNASKLIQDDLLSLYSHLSETSKFNRIFEYFTEKYIIKLEHFYVKSFAGKNIEITKKLGKKISEQLGDKELKIFITENLKIIFRNICFSDSVLHLNFLFEQNIPDLKYHIEKYGYCCINFGAYNIYLKLKNIINLEQYNKYVLHSKNIKMIEFVLSNYPKEIDVSKYNNLTKKEIIKILYQIKYNKERRERKISMLFGIYNGLDHTKPIENQMFGMVSVSNLFYSMEFI